MTGAVLSRPGSLIPLSPTERLGWTLCLALALHVMVILGVGFSPNDRPRINRNNLEIVLVPTKTEDAPDKADYLAQANQDGGGESDSKERPSAPLPAPLTSKQAVIPASGPPPQPLAQVPEESAPKKPLLTRDKSRRQVKIPPKKNPKPKPVKKTTPVRRTVPKVVPRNRITAATLISQSREMATLNAAIDRKLRAYAEWPRRKFINARTREYKYAAYMDAWRAKVERIGNLNYPDEARRKRISGSLLMDVALNGDGSIREINLRRSSGSKVLDDAARRIVRLAAPFAAFPKGIRKETDILHIERTWQFLGSNRLFAR